MAALRDDSPSERALRRWRTDMPRRSARAQGLIDEAQKLLWLLDEARQELADACVSDDVEMVSRASKRVYSVGALLFDNARKLDRGPRLL